MATLAPKRGWLIPQDGDAPPDWGDNLRTILADINANGVFADVGVTFHGVSTFHSIGVPITSGSSLNALSTYDIGVFNNERFDTDNFHSVINPDRLTVPVGLAGRYLVGATLAWTGNAAGVRRLQIFKLGGNTLASTAQLPITATYITYQQVITLVNLAEGEQVELLVSQDSGISLTLLAGNANLQTFDFWMVRLGA